MASDLSIRMDKAEDPARLLADTEACLCTLLGTDAGFGLKCAQPFPAAEQQRNLATTVYSTHFPEDIVELTMLYTGPVPGYEAPEEEGWQTFITMRAALDNPLKYALAAALAISLAQTQSDTHIYDEDRRWNPQPRIAAGQLLQSLRVREPQNSLEEALKNFLLQLKTR
ncbi:MAG: hypothetical protein IBJ09_15780 [Bacteroidia bacterium]|nr:hypothetical protein [Bacteroidia bacterium]